MPDLQVKVEVKVKALPTPNPLRMQGYEGAKESEYFTVHTVQGLRLLRNNISVGTHGRYSSSFKSLAILCLSKINL